MVANDPERWRALFTWGRDRDQSISHRPGHSGDRTNHGDETQQPLHDQTVTQGVEGRAGPGR